jgi:uncharacterized membrane protein/thiol-disulfide isomerase/thioredoxin
VKRHHILIPILILVSLFIVPVINAHAQTNPPVVRAVLFYSPRCGHCQYVINETLLPLIEKYGGQLQIIGLDITQEYWQTFFLAALKKFNLEQAGVPFLVVDNIYLAGSIDIPEQFPILIETYLSQGGVDWPDIPGLREALSQSIKADDLTAAAPTRSAALQATPVLAIIVPTFTSPIATPGLVPLETHDLDWTDNFARDPVGNTLSILVLTGMLGSVAWAVTLFQKTNGLSLKSNWTCIIPILCVVGFGVAGYLAYVGTAQVTAVCGPVGDCNTVQQSEYAHLFGILPIGVLGLLGYIAIAIAWLIARYSHDRLAYFAAISLLVMTAFGTLFSIYLTLLEPFVIGATCAWCLTSAILMTILMLISVRPAKAAFSRVAHPRSLHPKHTRTGVHDD